MVDPRDAFVIHRLRAKPVEYSVTISHYVSNGEWMMGVTVSDVAMDTAEERERVSEDLRGVADMIEQGGSRIVTSEPQ